MVRLKVKSAAFSEMVEEGMKNVKAIQNASPTKSGDIDELAKLYRQAVAEKMAMLCVRTQALQPTLATLV